MKLAKLRSGRTKHDSSPSKSLTSPSASSVTPQRKKILRSSAKSMETPRPSRVSRKLSKELNSSSVSQEKSGTKGNKGVHLKPNVSDSDADEMNNLSNSSLSDGKKKSTRSKQTSANKKLKVKQLSPSKKASPKLPTLRSKLRSSKLSLSKTSIEVPSSHETASQKKNKTPSPSKRLRNVHNRDIASTSKQQDLSIKSSPNKEHELKEPVIRLERLSEIVKAKRSSGSSISSHNVKILVNDELLTDYNVSVTQDVLDSINSPNLSGRKRLALVASTPKVQQVLDSTLTVESEQEKKKDDTYELIEPKTPRLRRLKSERVENESFQSNVKDTIVGQNLVKKKGNVQFTSPLLQYRTRKRSSVENKQNTSLKIPPKNSRKVLKSVTAVSRPNNSANGKTPVANRTLTSLLLRKSSSSHNAAASSPLSPRKTPDPKSSAKKKMPNFVEIHKKMFEKSESIVDAKRRVQDRHTALTGSENGDTTGTRTVKKLNPLSNGSKNGFNRYGFKLRKPEATAYISKTKPTNPRRSTEQNRAVLKGVRTNRRFELQMKMRNLINL